MGLLLQPEHFCHGSEWQCTVILQTPSCLALPRLQYCPSVLLSHEGHASCLMPHASCLMPHASCLMPHASCLMPHASCLMPQPSCLMPHASGKLCECACEFITSVIHCTTRRLCPLGNIWYCAYICVLQCYCKWFMTHTVIWEDCASRSRTLGCCPPRGRKMLDG